MGRSLVVDRESQPERQVRAREVDVMRSLLRSLTMVGTLAVTMGLAPAAASAAVATDAEFGEHVAHCAQMVCLSGQHNPGMHQGYAGHGDMEHDC
jgi:Spy/CpxP family protein refolding chaperone